MRASGKRLVAALALFAGVLLPPLATYADDAGTEHARRLAHDTDSPGAGTLQLSSPDGHGSPVDALLLTTQLQLDVTGMLGELSVQQSFMNTTDRWLDGNYLFPLPPDAAVRGLTLRVGERTIIGEIQEREQARETYESARAEGRVAGMVEQQRPNLFTARIASIAPGSDVHVTFDVLVPVKASDEGLSLTLPTTLTPRYRNAHAANARAVASPILRADQITGPRFSLAARISPLDQPADVWSPTHDLDSRGQELLVKSAAMDRDLILLWPFANGQQPSASVYVAEHADTHYVQLFMAPPEQRAEDLRLARELVLIVDTSGSMAGISMNAARAAAHSALDGLDSMDTFNLIAFDDETHVLFDNARPATRQNVATARRFISQLNADGGTEMASALARALEPVAAALPTRSVAARQQSDDARGDEGSDEPGDLDGRRASGQDQDASVTPVEARLRQVVFLTDGSIADETRLLQQIERDIGSSRLFTVGIGSAPNEWFLDKAAELGRGAALTVRDVDDVEQAVGELLGRLAQPVLTDIRVEFPGTTAESYPSQVPDLYAHEPLMVATRLEGAVSEAIVSGWQGDAPFTRRIPLDLAQARPDTATGEERVAPGLAMHWARSKVSSLLDEQRTSRNEGLNEAEVTTLALEVGLVTPYTSFVAAEKTPVRPKTLSSAEADVANLVPFGNEMLNIAIPQGAAGIDTLGVLGLLAGLLGSVLLWCSRALGQVRPTRSA